MRKGMLCMAIVITATLTFCISAMAQELTVNYGSFYGINGSQSRNVRVTANGGYNIVSGKTFLTSVGTVVMPASFYGEGATTTIQILFQPNDVNGSFGGHFTSVYTNGHENLTLYISVSGDSMVPTATALPKYKVTSIIYAPPGNNSSNGFTNSTTNGTTTSIGQSFQTQISTTFSYGFRGVGSIGATFGTATTTGNSSEFTETFSSGTGISNASNPVNTNAINHRQDEFLIWLNPKVLVTQSGPNSTVYDVSTQTNGSGKAEEPDQVEVFAEAMEANSQGMTSVPVNALKLQRDAATGQADLPGLAAICAHPTYYPNNCTQANQCGCTPSDFAGILAQDPLLNYSTAQSPLSADVSGVQACTSPSTSDNCRYVPVTQVPGGNLQVLALLSGPDCEGCNIPNNSYTQSDSTQSTQTLSGSSSVTVGSTWTLSAGFGPSLTNTTQFTWTDSQSEGAISGQVNQLNVNLSSSTVDCYEEVPVFEDTVFHTFVFQQPSGNDSCP